MLTPAELDYMQAREVAVRIVASVHGVIDRGLADRIEKGEEILGLERAEELSDLAFLRA